MSGSRSRSPGSDRRSRSRSRSPGSDRRGRSRSRSRSRTPGLDTTPDDFYARAFSSPLDGALDDEETKKFRNEAVKAWNRVVHAQCPRAEIRKDGNPETGTLQVDDPPPKVPPQVNKCIFNDQKKIRAEHPHLSQEPTSYVLQSYLPTTPSTKYVNGRSGRTYGKGDRPITKYLICYEYNDHGAADGSIDASNSLRRLQRIVLRPVNRSGSFNTLVVTLLTFHDGRARCVVQ
jgi:hypothetical protein